MQQLMALFLSGEGAPVPLTRPTAAAQGVSRHRLFRAVPGGAVPCPACTWGLVSACQSAPCEPLRITELFTAPEQCALSHAGGSWTQQAPAADAAAEHPDEHEPAQDTARNAGGDADDAQAAEAVTAKGRTSKVCDPRHVMSLADEVQDTHSEGRQVALCTSCMECLRSASERALPYLRSPEDAVQMKHLWCRAAELHCRGRSWCVMSTLLAAAMRSAVAAKDQACSPCGPRVFCSAMCACCLLLCVVFHCMHRAQDWHAAGSPAICSVPILRKLQTPVRPRCTSECWRCWAATARAGGQWRMPHGHARKLAMWRSEEAYQGLSLDGCAMATV